MPWPTGGPGRLQAIIAGVVDTVLFANPSAQSGKAADWVDRARRLLARAGVPHEFIATEPDGATVGLVRRAIDEQRARRVIYMGGDGTFAEVAKGILASEHAAEVAMGMLPTGTANDQGKSFGLRPGPGALEENVAVIAAGMTLDIDVGRLQRLDEAGQVTDSGLFFDSASFGLGAAVLATRNRDRGVVEAVPLLRHLYRDRLVYAGAVVQQFLGSYLTPCKFDMEAVIGRELHRFSSLLDVIVKNTRIYGGEWVLAPGSAADDGVFELLPIAGRRDFTAKMVATLRHNPVGEEALRRLGIELSPPVPGRSFSLTVIRPGAPQGIAAQIDGEEFPAGDHFRIDVLRRILRLIVPRTHVR